VEDLVAALSSLDEFEVSEATDIEISGFSGKQLTLTAPAEPSCDSLSTWATTTRKNGVGAGEVNEVRILDVNGTRLVISVAHGAELTPDQRTELDTVVDSIVIGA
jgi:hypothetical protein